MNSLALPICQINNVINDLKKPVSRTLSLSAWDSVYTFKPCLYFRYINVIKLISECEAAKSQ